MVVGTYPAVVTEITDGDTFKVTLDFNQKMRGKDRDYGFHLYVENGRLVLHADVRLFGCNAREHTMPGGKEASQNLATVMPVGTKVTVHSYGPDKYGERFDMGVTLPDGRDLTQLLIDTEWAAAWDGHGTKPVPPWPRTLTRTRRAR